MKPFFVLCITFVIALVIDKVISNVWDLRFAGNTAMSVMLLFTSIGHFMYVNGMMLMLPPFIPYKKWMVYATGVLEIFFSTGLFIPSLQIPTAYGLIAFFILVLPCNVYAAIRKVDYQQGTYTGPGTSYLLFRVPFQILLVFWVYVCNLYHPI